MEQRKRIFLSYRFTGEDPHELAQTLGNITRVLRAAGYDVYCSIEDQSWFSGEKKTNREIMEHAFSELDKSDILLAFIRSDEKSEGMLIEIGYAIAKGKVFALALKNGVKTTSITEMASPLITFDSLEELCEKMHGLPF